MALPAPEPGLVICYSYLWHFESERGLEEGRKDRPCVIVFEARQNEQGETWVTVLPVTHVAPRNADDGVEIPLAAKRHLGLDDDRSWIVVNEGNEFVWPGYDLRPVPGTSRFSYGFLPPRLFEKIARAFVENYGDQRARLVERS